MPKYSVWTIRCALIYLATGFTFGGLLLANKGVTASPAISPIIWQLLPAHMEFLLVGWMVQLVLGMAFWILPRFSLEPKRGNVSLAWLSFGLLNLGIWLAGFAPLFGAQAWLLFAGRAAQAGAALAFAAHAWPRVKPAGA